MLHSVPTPFFPLENSTENLSHPLLRLSLFVSFNQYFVSITILIDQSINKSASHSFSVCVYFNKPAGCMNNISLNLKKQNEIEI